MKTTLSFGLIVAVAGTLACSDDEGTTPRGTAGTGTGNAGSAGTGSGGSAGTGSGGSAGTGSGGSAGTGTVAYEYGPEITITAVDGVGNVEEETTDILGGTFLAQSANMTVPATEAHRDGALCFSGTTAVVPDGNSYGTYWGAELGLNLKLIPDPAAGPVADAGADAGGPALIVDPAGWPYGNVIGFSYKLVGNDEAAADKGVPASRLRFKALPVGSNGENDTYCSNRDGLTDGAVDNVLFDDITFECWTPANPSIGPDEATINVVDPGPPRVVNTPPNPKALQNITWQIASDIAATTPAPIAFNFCITELKPIIGP